MKWIDKIKRATKNGKFTASDIEKAKSFHVCAVGEHFELHKKQNLGLYYKISSIYAYAGYSKKPKRKIEKINKLGIDFNHAVMENNFKKAKKIHDQIHKFNKVI